MNNIQPWLEIVLVLFGSIFGSYLAVRVELATQRTILGAINEVYDRGPTATDALAEDAVEDLDHLASEISQETQDLLEASDDAPIIKLVNSLLQHAVKERASDIHLEPFEREIRVRFRIDDILYEPVRALPRALMAPIVSRIKILGSLNIAEKRLPQDGRIRLKIAGRDYDVRLSTIPVTHGERGVMRLLPRTAGDIKSDGLPTQTSIVTLSSPGKVQPAGRRLTLMSIRFPPGSAFSKPELCPVSVMSGLNHHTSFGF